MAFAAVAAGIGAVGSIAGGISASNASTRAGKNALNRAKQASRDTLAETQRAQALQQQQYNQNKETQYAINEQNKAYMEPYRQAGITGQNRLLTLMGLNGGDGNAADFGRYAKDFQMSDYQADPGVAYRLQQGIDAMNKMAAARGGLMSGSAIKGGIKFGQEMGSEEYGNAYARYQQNRANQLNPLGSFATAGMNAAQNTSATNALYGGQMGDASRAYANTQNELGLGGQARASGYLTGGQEAQAAGRMGGQSAMNTGFSNAGSSLQNALLMNRLFPSSGGGGFGNFFNPPTTGGVIDGQTPGLGRQAYS